MTYKFKVLSIDGGGIRGIVPAIILNEIEKRTGKRIFELFDLIAGTSTGGILALGLTKRHPNHPDQAQYKAEDLVTLYKNEGKVIFAKRKESLLEQLAEKQLKTILNYFKLPAIDPDDIFRTKYPSTGREKILHQYFGETPIEQALKKVFITSYDTVLRTPIFFLSNPKEEKIGESFRKICTGFTMKQAAMATSAAPTFFEPYRVSTHHRTDDGFYTLVDGGVFANNPAALALMEAIIASKKEGKKLELDEILVVSLGTGSLTRKFLYDQTKNWGLMGWVQPIINITMDGASESVACQLEQLLPRASDQPKQYYRFQAFLNPGKGNDEMDDVSDENLRRLENLAKEIIAQSADLDELCKNLLKTPPSS